MPVMIRKLLEDFSNANAIDNSLITRQIDIENGVDIFSDMIKKVRMDIKTLDEQAYNTLEQKVKELDEQNILRKNQIKNKTVTNDSIERRQLELKLLREDHGRYKQELVIMQNICYKKGWFD